jgi:hypothetical protein
MMMMVVVVISTMFLRFEVGNEFLNRRVGRGVDSY